MSTKQSFVKRLQLTSLAATLSNEELKQFILSKIEWLVKNKESTINFISSNNDSQDIETDLTKIKQIIRNRNYDDDDDNDNDDDMNRKRIQSLDQLPEVLICAIANYLCIAEYLNLTSTAKVFFIYLNNKNGTHLVKLDIDKTWSSEQVEKQLYKHQNLQQLSVYTNQVIKKSCNDDFKLKKLRDLTIIIQNGINLSNKLLIKPKYWKYKKIMRLSIENNDNIQETDIIELKKILSKCNDLSCLILSEFHIESLQTINWLDDVKLPKLKKLTLINSVGFALIVKFGHQLEKLIWWNVNPWVQQYSRFQRFNHLVKCNFNQLQQLSFDAIQYSDIDGILKTAKNLKKIEMTNSRHCFEHTSGKNIKDLVKLLFIKSTKLAHFEFEFVDIVVQENSFTVNSPASGYDGIIQGLQNTKQIQRNKFVLKLKTILSLKHLTHIVNAFKLSNTKTLVLNFQGTLYHDFYSTSVQTLYDELDYDKENAITLIQETVKKLFDKDDSLYSFDVDDQKQNQQNLDEHFELTLINDNNNHE